MTRHQIDENRCRIILGRDRFELFDLCRSIASARVLEPRSIVHVDVVIIQVFASRFRLDFERHILLSLAKTVSKTLVHHDGQVGERVDVGSRLKSLDGVPIGRDTCDRDWLSIVKLSNSNIPKRWRVRERLERLPDFRIMHGCEPTIISAASVSSGDFMVAKL